MKHLKTNTAMKVMIDVTPEILRRIADGMERQNMAGPKGNIFWSDRVGIARIPQNETRAVFWDQEMTIGNITFRWFRPNTIGE